MRSLVGHRQLGWGGGGGRVGAGVGVGEGGKEVMHGRRLSRDCVNHDKRFRPKYTLDPAEFKPYIITNIRLSPCHVVRTIARQMEKI